MQAERVCKFYLFEQRFLLLDAAIDAVAYAQGALHHLGRHVAYVAPVKGVLSYFAGLHLVTPGRLLAGGLGQAAYIFFETLVLIKLIFILCLLIVAVTGVGAPFDANAVFLQRHDMVHRSVQKAAVVADQKEARLAGEIHCGNVTPPHVQVIGRLVDQQKAVFAQKQGAQQQPRALAGGEA